MWSQEAQVTIDAPAHEVWKVLIDIDSYPAWNRYASSAVGDLRVGGEVVITVPRGKARPGPVNNRVTELVENERLCWQSLSWYRFLAYGVRCRIIEAQLDGSTLFREVETMYGVMASAIKRSMGTQLLAGIQTECNSLKEEVERRARGAN